MNPEKIEKIIISVKKDLENYGEYGVRRSSILYAKVKNLITLSLNTLPEHKTFLTTAWGNWNSYSYRSTSKAISIIDYILELLRLEKSVESKIAGMKIFESANEKLKQAVQSFQKEDYSSTIHNLNTALELILKDKLEIPTTITKINTSKIIDISVKHKLGPYTYLSEAQKHVCLVDNKIKHQGYSPSKIDCINGIKVMEELISKFRDKEIKLTEEIRKKIYAGIGFSGALAKALFTPSEFVGTLHSRLRLIT